MWAFVAKRLVFRGKWLAGGQFACLPYMRLAEGRHWRLSSDPFRDTISKRKYDPATVFLSE